MSAEVLARSVEDSLTRLSGSLPRRNPDRLGGLLRSTFPEAKSSREGMVESGKRCTDSISATSTATKAKHLGIAKGVSA